MHVVGIRRTLAEQHPWLPGAVFKAFEQAKQLGLKKLSDTSATKVTLPFVEEALKDARALMGEDFWSYGVEPNRKVLDYFLGQHHAAGPVLAAGVGRRIVSSGDVRDIQAVTRGAGGTAAYFGRNPQMRASKWCALAIWLTSLSPAHAQDSAAAAAACDKLATNAQSGCFEKLANAADAKLEQSLPGRPENH